MHTNMHSGPLISFNISIALCIAAIEILKNERTDYPCLFFNLQNLTTHRQLSNYQTAYDLHRWCNILATLLVVINVYQTLSKNHTMILELVSATSNLNAACFPHWETCTQPHISHTNIRRSCTCCFHKRIGAWVWRHTAPTRLNNKYNKNGRSDFISIQMNSQESCELLVIWCDFTSFQMKFIRFFGCSDWIVKTLSDLIWIHIKSYWTCFDHVFVSVNSICMSSNS